MSVALRRILPREVRVYSVLLVVGCAGAQREGTWTGEGVLIPEDLGSRIARTDPQLAEVAAQAGQRA